VQTPIAHFPVPIRLGFFVTALLVLWVPFAGLMYWLWGTGNTVSILTMLLLYGEFVFLLQIWGRIVHQQAQPLRYYGLRGGLDLLMGLGFSLLSLFGLFLLEGGFGWLVWRSPIVGLPRIILEGLAVALGVGLAEELLFRGWLLDELERDYRPGVALWTCSTLFALLHFIKPLEVIQRSWPQFLGLLLLGLMLVQAKRLRQGRLGLPIGLHAGLVWGYYIVDVADLVNYPSRVPDWITGINGHPLAGVMGLLFLGGMILSLPLASKLLPSSETS